MVLDYCSEYEVPADLLNEEINVFPGICLVISVEYLDLG